MYTFNIREWYIKKNKKSFLLKVAKVLLVIGIVANIGIITLTSLTNRATAEYIYSHARSTNFQPVSMKIK